MKTLKVRLTLTEEALGMMPTSKEVHEEFIASKAPDAPSIEEEVEAVGVEEVVEKQKTVFPRMADGTPFFWDYQMRGMIKDSLGMLKRATGTIASKMTAYKKIVDGLIFVQERKIPIHLGGEMGDCQRPLRASGPSGERTALAHSETIPEGSWCEFTFELWKDDLDDAIRECLDYGRRRGLAQWRNSGKGTFEWDELDDDGNIIGGNHTEEGRKAAAAMKAKKAEKAKKEAEKKAAKSA